MKFRGISLVIRAALIFCTPVFAFAQTPSDILQILQGDIILAAPVISETNDVSELGNARSGTVFVPTFSAGSGAVNLEFDEPGSLPGENPSDLLTIIAMAPIGDTQPVFYLFQSSDLVSHGTTFVNETGDFQDVTSFFPNLNGSGLTIKVFSDVDAVPQPTSVLLLLAGLTGIVGAHRWSKRNTS